VGWLVGEGNRRLADRKGSLFNHTQDPRPYTPLSLPLTHTTTHASPTHTTTPHLHLSDATHSGAA